MSHTFCVAPMMDWSDTHCRSFWRTLTRQALLYTEMVTTGALLHGDPARWLRYQPAEHPLALQLGGSDPVELARCARLAADWGYDEVNLNVGCPSDRVQSGRFGACLMAEPGLVRDCLAAMLDACELRVTVKHRIGIDQQESEQWLHDFIGTVAESGCRTFIIHARKAILSGLSPKQNREIPPLRYPVVYRVKALFPALQIVLNGGITSLAQCDVHLQHVDGVMLGRAAYHDPWLLARVDSHCFGYTDPVASREQALRNFMPYIQSSLDAGCALNHISRHLLGLFQGVPGARRFRRMISERAHRHGAGCEVLEEALAQTAAWTPAAVA